MEAGKGVRGRAFCPGCGAKYAIPEEALRRRAGLRFRASCTNCDTDFTVRWDDGELVTEKDERTARPRPPQSRDVLRRGARVGKYEIEEMLSSGGSATVYRAFEMGANRQVALKVLHRPPDSDYGVRFRREVEVQGNLKHPNLMPIFDQGAVEGKPYYSMELLHKPTTLETIAGLFRTNRLGYNPSLRTLNSLEALVRKVLLPVTRAVAFANANGIIHRDLKPANVIVDARTLHVYVIDFGICHLFKETGSRLVLRAGDTSDPTEERKRMAMGTPRFMPPEQARGEVSERGDVWQLGALLHYLLAGDAPVAPAIDLRRVGMEKRIANLQKIAESSREAGDEDEAAFYEKRIEELRGGDLRGHRDVLKDAQQGVYQPLPAGTDPALAAIADRAMRPDPADRYPTAEHVTREFEAWLAERPVRAYAQRLGQSKGAMYRGRLFARRNKTTLVVVSSVLALVLVFAVLQVFREASRRERQVETLLAQARASGDPAVQEDRLTKLLALRPGHAEAERLLAQARVFAPIKARIEEALAVKERVKRLRAEGEYELAEREADDMAAVLEGSVLKDLRSLAADYPGRSREREAMQLAHFLRGRRMLHLGGVPAGIEVALVPPRSRGNPALRWDAPLPWGTSPLPVSERSLESGSYVLLLRAPDGAALHLPFRVDFATPGRVELTCPIDPRAIPDGMAYVAGAERRFGDPRFHERAEVKRIAPFFIDRTEVTNAAYARYVATLDDERAERAVPRRLVDARTGRTAPLWPRRDGRFVCPEGAEALPVTGISQLDARAFAAWANKRLPTPEEWELAARGFDERDYPFGNSLTPDACNVQTGTLAAAGAHPRDRSPFGVLDMAGNAAEWTARTIGAQAVVKGGSIDLQRYRAIASSFGRREAAHPYEDVGFRCVRPAD